MKDFSSGEQGIRTPEPVTVNGFQDRRIRPLCQLSAAKVQIFSFMQNFISNFQYASKSRFKITYRPTYKDLFSVFAYPFDISHRQKFS